jgi:SAM-dependent methyltransferase
VGQAVIDEHLQRWNARFGAAEYIFGTAPNAFLASQKSRLKRGQRALCIADGEGRNSVWLAEQGLEVVAFDFSPVAVEKARRLAKRRGVEVRYEVASVREWRWPESDFDVVVAIFVQFADPATRRFMFEHMIGALRPGGLVLGEGYTPAQLKYATGGPKEVDQLYTEDMLREALGALEILELRAYEAELNEGTRHTGTALLVTQASRSQAARIRSRAAVTPGKTTLLRPLNRQRSTRCGMPRPMKSRTTPTASGAGPCSASIALAAVARSGAVSSSVPSRSSRTALITLVA